MWIVCSPEHCDYVTEISGPLRKNPQTAWTSLNQRAKLVHPSIVEQFLAWSGEVGSWAQAGLTVQQETNDALTFAADPATSAHPKANGSYPHKDKCVETLKQQRTDMKMHK